MNVGALLSNAASKHPERTCVVVRGDRLSFAGLESRTNLVC